MNDQPQQEHFSLPFPPYGPQQELLAVISAALRAPCPLNWPPDVHYPRIVAAELPTGCGKTCALLGGVLSFQASLTSSAQSASAVAQYFSERCHCSLCRTHRRNLLKAAAQKQRGPKKAPTTRDAAARDVDDDDDINTIPSLSDEDDSSFEGMTLRISMKFRQHISGPSHKRLRSDKAVVINQRTTRTSSDLKHQHSSPPCTIFYATRTHTQLSQCVKEVRRFADASTSRLKHNVMASRAHYCVHSRIRSMADSAASDRNQLGEMCDKLVELRQCEAVERFSELAHRALTTPLHRSKSACGGGCHTSQHDSDASASYAWDIEDLVSEGVVMRACPYYASRELALYAGINFVTYAYLLDPIIRHESKLEGALHNHSVVILDEGHNVAGVGQDALSMLGLSQSHLTLLRREVAPLRSTSGGTAGGEVLQQYPRDFRLTRWSLAELFDFLDDEILAPLWSWCSSGASHKADRGEYKDASPTDTEGPWSTFHDAVKKERDPLLRLEAFMSGRAASQDDCRRWSDAFLQLYGVLSSLGVTFNPFELSVWAVGVLKRLLMVLRFAIQYPLSYAVWVESGSSPPLPFGGTTEPPRHPTVSLNLRCLDGSLAFHHLSKSCYAVIMASGTLGPFPQLMSELRLPRTTRTLETMHVVDTERQFRIGVVSSIEVIPPRPLQCTYQFFQDDICLQALARTVLQLSISREVGNYGVLVFVPNFRVAERLHLIAEELVRTEKTTLSSSEVTATHRRYRRVRRVLVETKQTKDAGTLLDAHRCAMEDGMGAVSILVAVYRGKLSEGVDFKDDMARLVLCVGVPLRPVVSRAVEAQRAFSGPLWYAADAVRAVNQAIGRSLRHASDFGAVVLLDHRYAATASEFAQQLPKWCRCQVQTWASPPDACEALKRFFNGVDGDGSLSRKAAQIWPKSQLVGQQPVGEALLSVEAQSALAPHNVFRFSLQGLEPSTLDAPGVDTKIVKPASSKLSVSHSSSVFHLYRSTALKLLCEASNDAAEIYRSHVESCVTEMLQDIL